MTEKPAKPEKKRNIWRWHALYIPLAAVLVAAFIVDVLVLISSCEAVKCESALTVVSYILVAYLVFCVCVIYMAHCFQLGGSEDERQKIINSALSFVALFLVIMGAVDAYTTKYYIGDEQLALEAWVGGILAIWGLFLLARRTANQDKQLTIQINKEIDDRFIAAVTLLGSRESSARTGAVYSLYHLAIESEKYRKQIAQILCSHIRSKTQEKSYQKDHEKRPSNEIQTAIDILFKDVNGVKGLYCHDFAQEGKFPRANLSYAYLRGADFKEAECYGANFSFVKCRAVDFFNAGFQGANFSYGQFWEAQFCLTSCQGANFMNAQCWRADFMKAGLQGADFEGAQCYGSTFTDAECQGANFDVAAFQSAIFMGTNFEGAYAKSIPSVSLESRIGKPTEVNTAIFGGEFSLVVMEDEIEKNKDSSFDLFFTFMRNVQKRHRGENLSRDLPNGIDTGVLDDNSEIRFYVERIKGAK